MPGDLRNPEFTPYYYDSKYEPGLNPFEPGSGNIKKYLQSIAIEKGFVINPDTMAKLLAHMDQKGFLHRNPGDESFRNEVIKYLNKIKQAKKVAEKWLT